MHNHLSGNKPRAHSHFTRRGFMRVAAGAAAMGLATRQKALAQTAAPWSVVLVPDPQYMAATYVCATGPTAYDNLMGWIVANRNLPVDGVRSEECRVGKECRSRWS